MKSPILLSAPVWQLTLASAARADVSVQPPATFSGGNGTVSDIVAADDDFYTVAR